jgi:putative heme-binding domain-containing protein
MRRANRGAPARRRYNDVIKSLLVLGACVAGVSWAAPSQDARRPRSLAVTLPETNPYASPEDVEIGRRLYEGRCGHCHGQSGEGGRGAVLNGGRFRHGGSDRALFGTIRNGIQNTEMSGAFNLPEREIWRLVAYVQQLGRRGVDEPSLGDATLGASVYKASGCSACHSIAGAGGVVGPDLTDIGARRAVHHLRQSIVDPSADIALDFRPVSVVDRHGHTITGIHLNEDEYSVHLRDADGSLRSFMKNDLTRMTLPRASLMPAFTAMPPVELENLLAYLSSLRSSGDLAAGTELWTFDRLEDIGGHKTTLLGQPTLIDSPGGRAVLFDGVDDALFVDNHPLAGAVTFTWEAIFRPDGGETEQRWFHLSEQDPATGLDTDNRMLFEIRVVGDQWFLDSYNQSGSASKALMNRTALHPLGAWYHVASVYDGTEFSNYVDGVREGAAELRLTPHGPGHASVGVRINKVFYFKGAVHLARFTRRALSPSEFLRAPGKP